MENCPFCGAPGSFSEAVDGCCYVCGMVLPQQQVATAPATDSIFSEEAIEEAPREVKTEDSANAPTIALETQPMEMADDGSINPPAIQLIKPRKLSPEYARRVTAAWDATKSPFKNPQETLNSSSSKASDSSNLLIGSRSVSDADDPRPADYELTKIIGEGNMGTVWSARQSSLDRPVALKVPKDSLAASSLGRELFISEVVVTGQLDHPNIVPIYDLARDESGNLFYAMKKVEGRSWDECIHEEGRTRIDNVEILMKVCDAIRFAHDRGVLHRDIKPQNIMVGQYGEVSVMDWGIALKLDEQLRVPGASRVNPSGTPAYMAPEMATGNAAELGPHTDVYLLGAVLYEIITGEPPHPAPDPSHDPFVQQNACLLIAARNVITPANETGELIDIAYKAMATDISDRFPSVEEFQEAIREYYSHSESIALTERGQDHLAKALAATNGVYEDYNKARFAFEEAVQLWSENSRARSGLAQATLEHAGTALKRGDYALGLSLLNRDNPTHADLAKKLTAAKKKSERYRSVAKVSALAASCILIVATAISSWFWLGEKVARESAQASERAAVQARNAEQRQREAAEVAKLEAEASEKRALAAKDAEEAQRMQAEAATVAAEDARKKETLAKESALKAKESETVARQQAQEASYRSEIGLAAEEVRRNAFSSAHGILASQANNETQKGLRNWEWGYLNYLAKEPSIARFEIEGVARIETVALSADQKWIVAGDDGGQIHVWYRPDTNQPAQKLPSRTKAFAVPVAGVAISRDNRTVVGVGGREVHFWALPPADNLGRGLASTGQPLRYTSRLLSVAVAPAGDRLLTSAEDSTAQLWSTSQSDRPLHVYQGHLLDPNSGNGQVWQARFSPDGNRITTAGADGTVRLWDVQGKALRTFEGHQGPVYTSEFSPDGKFIISGGRDRRLLAWDLQANAGEQSRADSIRERLATATENGHARNLRPLGEHGAAIRCVTFAPDGKTLYSASDDNTLRVWNVAQGVAAAQLEKSLRAHGGWVRSCSASADGKHVLTGSYDGQVFLWNWERYRFPRVLRPESDRSLSELRFTAAVASPNARWIGTAAEDGTVTVWDMSDPLNPAPQQLREGHDWQATTGVYFPGGNRLLTAAGDNSALIWDARRGNQLLRIGGWNRTGGSGWRGIAAVAHHGRTIATGSDELGILATLWDAQSGRLIATLKAPQSAQRDELPEATAITFSPNDETLFVGDQWGECYLFKTENGTLARSPFSGHSAKINAAAFLPDGRLLTASSDWTVAKWNLKANEAAPQPERTFEHRHRVVAMDVSRDGKFFVTATDSNDNEAVLRVWNVNSADKHVQQISPDALSRISGAKVGSNNMPDVRSIAVHPTQTEALVTVFDPRTSTYRLGRWQWSAGTSKVDWDATPLRDTAMAVYSPNREGSILTVGGRGARLRFANRVEMTYRPQTRVGSIAFSSDSGLLASASDDGSIKLWRFDGQRWLPEHKLLGGHQGAVNSVAFHPLRPDMLLSAGDDGTAKIWQRAADDWKPATIGGNAARGGPVRQAIFSPADANQVVSILTAADRELKVWSSDGRLLKTMTHDGPVQCIAVSQDGKWIATGVGSNAWVWNAASPQAARSQELAGHSAEITSLAFSPDGNRLFTASRDFTVKLWDTNAWRELLTLESHTDSVVSVSFFASPTHPSLLTAGAEGQAILWPSVNWRD